MKKLMRSGEFAKVCETTKETLRHYERVGLLLPSCVMDNGYKLYSSSQIVDFMVIASLKAAGCALGDVKDIISSDNPETVTKIFAKKIGEISEKQAQLERSKLLLEGTVSQLNQARPWWGSANNSQWRISRLDCACYIETPIPLQVEQPSLIFESVANHEAYCQSNGIGYGAEWQKTYRLSNRSFVSGNYSEDFYVCTRVEKKLVLDRFFVRPAGSYLERIDHLPISGMENGADALPSNPLAPVYAQFKLYAKENNLALSGDVYTTEIARESISGKAYLSVKTSIALLD
ncbi:MAG: MerR family transcriptional regulator [Actinomycetota bacterium]|nr:MerR family transcriptional regulator [Actinomycetota bacterium]